MRRHEASCQKSANLGQNVGISGLNKEKGNSKTTIAARSGSG
jgi:hypothetical protein